MEKRSGSCSSTRGREWRESHRTTSFYQLPLSQITHKKRRYHQNNSSTWTPLSVYNNPNRKMKLPSKESFLPEPPCRIQKVHLQRTSSMSLNEYCRKHGQGRCKKRKYHRNNPSAWISPSVYNNISCKQKHHWNAISTWPPSPLLYTTTSLAADIPLRPTRIRCRQGQQKIRRKTGPCPRNVSTLYFILGSNRKQPRT